MCLREQDWDCCRLRPGKHPTQGGLGTGWHQDWGQNTGKDYSVSQEVEKVHGVWHEKVTPQGLVLHWLVCNATQFNHLFKRSFFITQIQLWILFLYMTNQNAMRGMKGPTQNWDLLLNRVVTDSVIGIMKHSLVHLELCEPIPQWWCYFFPDLLRCT